MKKILFLSILICFCLVFSESASYGFAVNISPSSINATVKPGESISGTINVINKGHSDIGIVAYAQDWLYNPGGTKTFYDGGTTPFSCAKWIRLFPKKFRLEAGKSMGVQYIITVPEEVKSGYYSVIFFESISLDEAESEKEGVQVQFAGRLGATVYLEIEGKAVYNGSIRSLAITPPQSNKPFEMKLLFENTGNVFISAKGTINIIDEEGKVLGKKKFVSLNTLPGDIREGKAEWFGELGEGTYYAVVTLDIGPVEPIVKEVKFNVSSGAVIGDFSFDISREKPLFSVLVENTGHLNIDASGRIELSKDGKLVKRLNLKKILIAPGKEKGLESVLEKELAPGIYTAKAIIFIGDKELTKEEVFSIK